MIPGGLCALSNNRPQFGQEVAASAAIASFLHDLIKFHLLKVWKRWGAQRLECKTNFFGVDLLRSSHGVVKITINIMNRIKVELPSSSEA
jgi:hypothetical protein